MTSGKSSSANAPNIGDGRLPTCTAFLIASTSRLRDEAIS
jgi:hypothetical protein